MDTGELSGKPNEMLGVVALLLVALCYRNRDKFKLNGPLGSSSDFTLDLFNSSPFFSILDHFHPFGYFLYSRAKAFLKAFQHLQTGFNPKKKIRITRIQLPSHRTEALEPEVPALEGPPFCR